MRATLITKKPRILILVALAVGTIAVAAAATPIAKTLASEAGRISPLPALAGVGLSIAAIFNRGLLQWWAQRSVGLDVEPGAITNTATVGFAANKILRSGGASGLAVFVRHGNRRGHTAGRVVGACAIASVASFVALGALMASTVVILAVTGRLAGWWIAAAIGFTIYSLLLTGVIVAVVKSPALTRRMFASVWRLKSRLVRAGDDPTERAHRAADELHDAIGSARTRPLALRRMLIHALLAKILGAMALFAAAAAADVRITVLTAVIIYASALATSLVSIVPGGVGPVEAESAAMMVSLGAALPAAVLAVALFRLFDMWIPVILGAWLGRHELRRQLPVHAEQELPIVLVSAPVPAVVSV